jgi:hypothetical protein
MGKNVLTGFHPVKGKGSLPPVWATWFKRLEVAA